MAFGLSFSSDLISTVIQHLKHEWADKEIHTCNERPPLGACEVVMDIC